MNTGATTGRIRGLAVLREAARFLGSMRFSPGLGHYAEGERVAIHVDASPRSDGRFSARITCLAQGGLDVDWEHLAAWAAPDSDDEDTAFRPMRFDRSGQALLANLPEGRFFLGSWPIESLAIPAAEPRPFGLAAAGVDAGPGALGLAPMVDSDDGRISLAILGNGAELTVSVEATDRALEGRPLGFVLAGVEDGSIAIRGEVTLRRDASGRLAGRWTGTDVGSGPFLALIQEPIDEAEPGHDGGEGRR